MSQFPIQTGIAAGLTSAEFETRLCEEINNRMAATPAMLHSISEAGLLVSVSDAWLAKLGYVREEVLGRRSTDFLTPESRERAVRDVVPEFFRTGRSENVQYQMIKKCGGVIDILISAVLADDPAGHGRVSLAVITDITALLETRRLLLESEARYRSLVEDQSEMVSLATPDGELRYVNHAYASLHGRQPEEMIGRSLLDFVPGDERAIVSERLRSVCASRDKIESENQVVLPGGEKRWIGWTNRALGDAEGRIAVIHSVGRDIQARVDAERLLQESEARYRFLAENSTDLILLVGEDGRRLYASPASRQLLGYEPEEAVALRLEEMIHPDDAPRVLAILSSRPGDTLLSYRMRRKDGSFLWVETTGKTVERTNGERQRLIIVRNIEERVKTEMRLKASEARLAEANRRLRTLAAVDGLTALANRRIFDEALAREVRRAQGSESCVALIMIDVDRFKAFNDLYGHPAGDACLRKIAQAISRSAKRPGDIAARYGGEEFAVILPATNEAGALTIAARIREAVIATGIEHRTNETGQVTVSAGIAVMRSGTPKDEEALLREADQALYRAKHGGRNTVVLASAPDSSGSVAA